MTQSKGNWKLFWKNQRGFTLIELAVVVFVISILIAMTLPHLRGAGEKAQAITCEGNQRLLRSQLENFYLAENGYPQGNDDAAKLQSMVDKRYLQTNPSCPSGGTYLLTLTPDGTGMKVECTKHGELGL